MSYFQGHFEVCKLLLDKMDDKNPQDFVNGLTPFMQASRNGHLDLSRFFLHGIEEKIEHPIVRFLYFFEVLLLFPNLFSFLGCHWPSYFATICFSLMAPFIYEAFYIYHSMLSIFPAISAFLAVSISVSSFMIFINILHLYFKSLTRNLHIWGVLKMWRVRLIIINIVFSSCTPVV